MATMTLASVERQLGNERQVRRRAINCNNILDTPEKGRDDLLGEFLPSFVNGERALIMPFGAYFDESERLEGGDPCCVAGFIFTQRRYVHFSQSWKRILASGRPGGIKAMHLKDLVAGKREFSGLPISRRQRILAECVLLLKETATGVAGAVVDQDEFEEVAGSDWPKRFGSIYTFLCLRAAQLAAYWLRSRKDNADPIVYTFESGHRWAPQTDAHFRGIAATPSLREIYQYGHHTFQPKVACYGAQAADIVAWMCIRIRLAGSVPFDSIQAFLPSLIDLAKWFETDALVTRYAGDELKQVIKENRERPPEREFKCRVGPAKRSFR